MSLNMLEIMAPAGDFDSLQAALDAGADAVYFGVGSLNMRSGAAVNFSEEDLPEVVMRCHAEKVRAYLTINTIIYDSEMDSMRRLCRLAKESGVD